MKGFITCEKDRKYWADMNDMIHDGEDVCREVRIWPEIKYQNIDGFGGAFTESSGYNLAGLPQDKQDEILQAYFGEDGLKYNLCRMHINSCDFALGNYAYRELGSDGKLTGFNTERDDKYITPMIKRAQAIAKDEIMLLASPWSPPEYMKTNREMNHGGKLKKECYGEWAEYICDYIENCNKKGIKISYLTVQNEPLATQTWDSCIYSGEEEGVYIREALAPALKRRGMSQVKILIWDHNKELLFDRVDATMKTVNDSNGSEGDDLIAGAAFHWYTGDHFESITMVHEKYPGLKLFFTEGCVEYSRFADSNEVGKAEMYAHDILGNLAAGADAYIDWNLLLDENGGPNHVGNFCAAPIMCDKTAGTYEKRLSYYYIGHFSRYIKRGAKRIALSKYSSEIEAAAFINPDGEIVTILLNRCGHALSVYLFNGTEGIMADVPAHSICTLV